ncbi:hypothetical protein HK102_005235, partial [Quaeritorhiza haematococci]
TITSSPERPSAHPKCLHTTQLPVISTTNSLTSSLTPVITQFSQGTGSSSLTMAARSDEVGGDVGDHDFSCVVNKSTTCSKVTVSFAVDSSDSITIVEDRTALASAAEPTTSATLMKHDEQEPITSAPRAIEAEPVSKGLGMLPKTVDTLCAILPTSDTRSFAFAPTSSLGLNMCEPVTSISDYHALSSNCSQSATSFPVVPARDSMDRIAVPDYKDLSLGNAVDSVGPEVAPLNPPVDTSDFLSQPQFAWWANYCKLPRPSHAYSDSETCSLSSPSLSFLEDSPPPVNKVTLPTNEVDVTAGSSSASGTMGFIPCYESMYDDILPPPDDSDEESVRSVSSSASPVNGNTRKYSMGAESLFSGATTENTTLTPCPHMETSADRQTQSVSLIMPASKLIAPSGALSERVKSVFAYLDYLMGVLALMPTLAFKIRNKARGTLCVPVRLFLGPNEVRGTGQNDFCQLARSNEEGEVAGAVGYTSSWLKVANLPLSISKVITSSVHVVVIDSEGKAFSWGDEDAVGRPGIEHTPTPICAPEELCFVAGACTESATALITDDGQVYWHGMFRSSANKTFVPTAFIKNEFVKLEFPEPVVAVGWCSYVTGEIVLENGECVPAVFGTGSNSFGELGLGHCDRVVVWTELKELRGMGIVSIAGGMEHTLILDTDGRVWGVGANSAGQLGIVGNPRNITTPTHITMCAHKPNCNLEDLPPIKFINAGMSSQSTYLVGIDGNLFTCGYNGYEQLGHGTDDDDGTDVSVPTLVPLNGRTLFAVGGGAQYSVLLLSPKVQMTKDETGKTKALDTSPILSVQINKSGTAASTSSPQAQFDVLGPCTTPEGRQSRLPVLTMSITTNVDPHRSAYAVQPVGKASHNPLDMEKGRPHKSGCHEETEITQKNLKQLQESDRGASSLEDLKRSEDVGCTLKAVHFLHFLVGRTF